MNSRQFAMLLWTVVIVGALAFHKAVRGAVWDVVKVFCSTMLLVPVILVLAWNAGIVMLLYRLDFWRPTMLFDTLVFVAAGGVGSLWKAASTMQTSGPLLNAKFFVKTVLVNLELIVFLHLLMDFSTFSFWLEFLVIVPVATALALLVTAAQLQSRLVAAQRGLSRLQSLLGLGILAWAVVSVIAHLARFATFDTLKSALLPFVLSVFFVPLLWVISVWMTYADAFSLLRVGGASSHAVRHMKWWMLRRFGLNLPDVQKFRRSGSYLRLAWATSESDADRILRTYDSAPEDAR
ncbi:MAG: hypothetical protein ACLQUT_03585 [Thermoleophilia bacterium]